MCIRDSHGSALFCGRQNNSLPNDTPHQLIFGNAHKVEKNEPLEPPKAPDPTKSNGHLMNLPTEFVHPL